MNLLIESHYLPSIPVFVQFIKHETIYIEAHETYQKQTYRNRCYILTANGILMLTVPVVKSESRSIKDTKIDYSQRWQQIHLRAIRSAYGKSPFFEFFFEDIENQILSNHVFLFDLNMGLMSKCLSFLKKKKEILTTESFSKGNYVDKQDLRGNFTPETIKPGSTELSYIYYYQVFGNKFVPNLSIIDLLFNEGTNASEILYKYK